MVIDPGSNADLNSIESPGWADLLEQIVEDDLFDEVNRASQYSQDTGTPDES